MFDWRRYRSIIGSSHGNCGIFSANDRFDDVELNSVAKNIGDHIYGDFGRVFFFFF